MTRGGPYIRNVTESVPLLSTAMKEVLGREKSSGGNVPQSGSNEELPHLWRLEKCGWRHQRDTVDRSRSADVAPPNGALDALDEILHPFKKPIQEKCLKWTTRALS